MYLNQILGLIIDYFELEIETNETKKKNSLIQNLSSENEALKTINSSLKTFIKDEQNKNSWEWC